VWDSKPVTIIIIICSFLLLTALHRTGQGGVTLKFLRQQADSPPFATVSGDVGRQGEEGDNVLCVGIGLKERMHMHPLRCCFGLPAVGTGAQDMGKFLAAFKRMGLSQRGAVALVGAHPFGRWATDGRIVE
jgi:hypothetical protein